MKSKMSLPESVTQQVHWAHSCGMELPTPQIKLLHSTLGTLMLALAKESIIQSFLCMWPHKASARVGSSFVPYAGSCQKAMGERCFARLQYKKSSH